MAGLLVVNLFLASEYFAVQSAVPAPSSSPAHTHPPVGAANHRARPSSPLPSTTVHDSSAAAALRARRDKDDLHARYTFSWVVDATIWWETDLSLKKKLEWMHEYAHLVTAHNERRFYRVMSEMSIRRIRTREQLREAAYRAAGFVHTEAYTIH